MNSLIPGKIVLRRITIWPSRRYFEQPSMARRIPEKLGVRC